MKQPVPVKVKVPKKKPEPVAPFPEHGHVCLNCGHEVSNNFCNMCGQSTGTHRLSIMHFILHDMVHSLWHVDRGIFFTLKEVLIRPGYAAIDYIRGRRAGRFPILTLLLLLIGLSLWLRGFNVPDGGRSLVRIEDIHNEFGKRLHAFATHNVKWLLLGLLPIGALSTLTIFRRTRLNYTEHLVVNSYVFAGLLVLLVIIKLTMLAIPSATGFLYKYEDVIGFLFYVFGYWQAYHKVYRPPGIIWRYAALLVMDIFLLIVVVIIAMGTIGALHPEWTRPGHLIPMTDSIDMTDTSTIIDIGPTTDTTGH